MAADAPAKSTTKITTIHKMIILLLIKTVPDQCFERTMLGGKFDLTYHVEKRTSRGM